MPLGDFRSVANVSDACAAAREYVPLATASLATRQADERLAHRSRFRPALCAGASLAPLSAAAEQLAHRSVSVAPHGAQRDRRFGYPLMLKARKLSYDGKGNAVVRSDGEMQVAHWTPHECLRAECSLPPAR